MQNFAILYKIGRQ